MRKLITFWHLCWVVFLSGAWTHANDSQFGLFLVDQSESMNQPEYAPRYLRALEAMVKEIDHFTQEAESHGRIPFYKIVSFNSETGYLERTAWTSYQEDALDALAYMFDEKGFESPAINRAICEASQDLALQGSLPNLARVYLFTDFSSNLNPSCDFGVDANPVGLTGIKDRVSPLLALAKTAQWRVFSYQGLPKEQRANEMKLSADPSADAEGTVLSKQNDDLKNENSLEHLATLSHGITIKINDSREFSEPSEPCSLFDPNCSRNKSGSSSMWQYYSLGKNTHNVKRLSSPIASGWYGGQLNINAQSSKPLSIVRYMGRTYMFSRGNSYENLHYAWSNDNGSSWIAGGYVQTGGPTVTTLTSPQAPEALVVNGKIRLYYLQGGYPYGPIKYIDTTGVSSSGSLYWSSSTHYTGLETLSTNGTVAAVVDPITDEEILVFGSRTTSAVSMYGRSLSNPGLWNLKKSFGSITSSSLEIFHSGSELCIAFMGTNYGLYFMKESANWVPHSIGTLTTNHKPGFAYLDGKMVIVYQTSSSNIYYISSTNGGVSWSTPALGVDQTNLGIDLIAYSYDLPFSCSISGPYFGEIGVVQTFTGSATNGTSPYSFQWSVDGIPITTGSQFNRTFLVPGSYLITLTATDANNNTTSTSRIFNATEPSGGCGRFIACPE